MEYVQAVQNNDNLFKDQLGIYDEIGENSRACVWIWEHREYSMAQNKMPKMSRFAILNLRDLKER